MGMFGALPAAASAVPAPQDLTPQHKGFFSPGGIGYYLAGGLADAVANASGGRGAFLPQVMERQQQQYQSQQQQAQRDAAWKQWVAQQQYKAVNPDPTSFQQDLQAAGIDPNSPQGRALYQKYVTNRADPIQGVPITNSDGSKGLQFIRPSQMPQAAPAPQVGEVQDGYRFTGGNPADPNSWQQVGGASPQGGASFR